MQPKIGSSVYSKAHKTRIPISDKIKEIKENNGNMKIKVVLMDGNEYFGGQS